MIDLRQAIGISFKDLELGMYWEVERAFIKVMQEVLKVLDGIVFDIRDQSRYVMKGIRKGNMATLFGDVEYCRRYYFDKETGRYVHA